MPQMAPMSWILLFMFFSFMLIVINTLNYYLFNPHINMTDQTKKIEIKNNPWTW